jgi:hypothetical protein
LCINENPGCQFIATNLDAVTHLTDAQEWAGNGAMAGAIKGCTGREPTLVGARPHSLAPMPPPRPSSRLSVRNGRTCRRDKAHAQVKQPRAANKPCVEGWPLVNRFGPLRLCLPRHVPSRASSGPCCKGWLPGNGLDPSGPASSGTQASRPR